MIDIDDYIKHFLSQKKAVSIETLEKLLSEKKRKSKNLTTNSNKSNIFRVNKKTVFIKSALLKYKEDFLNEFEDFLAAKVINKALKKNLINIYSESIPDILFAEWIEINIDKKFTVFELLYNLIFKQKKSRERVKVFLDELTDIYAETAVYSSLAIQYHDDNLGFIKKIEKHEKLLRDLFYTALIHPEKIKNNFEFYDTNLSGIKNKLKELFHLQFKRAENYSSILLKRIIINELKNFDFLKLLSRFTFSSFYEWLLFLSEEEYEPRNNLFQDLGI